MKFDPRTFDTVDWLLLGTACVLCDTFILSFFWSL